ncbi:MAG: hypothetical protein WAZ48_15125 [Lysobacteraceae bacterium]
MSRLSDFLYSPRNIAGCCLAFAGLVLLFTGVIDTGWPLIVAGLYAVGVLAWPRKQVVEVEAPSVEVSVETLAQQLERLINEASKRLPEPALASLHSIQATLSDLLPRLRELEVSGALSVESAFTVEETLRRYLPEMLTSYLKLPTAFARTQLLKDKRTAAQVLVDQLQMLDESLKQIAHESFAGDVEALVNSGRFLERKLRAKAAFEMQ